MRPLAGLFAAALFVPLAPGVASAQECDELDAFSAMFTEEEQDG